MPDLQHLDRMRRALGECEWLPIDSAPRDGRTVEMRQGSWAPFHAFWKNGQWHPIQFAHGLPATHWRPPLPLFEGRDG